MSNKGRKPVPTALKLLGGNPGKRKLNKDEPIPKIKLPSCPGWLEPESKKRWKQVGKKLINLGIMSDIDDSAFAAYCQSYARWKEVEEFLYY